MTRQIKRPQGFALAVRAACLSVVVALALSPAGPVTADPVAGADLVSAPQEIGLGQVVDVSKNGRIVLGVDVSGRWVVRDVVSGKMLRKLKYSSQNPGLSDDGRYVAYYRPGGKKCATFAQPWVLDRKTGKSRLAAATKSGKPLTASWFVNTCGWEEWAQVDRPTVTTGTSQMSGNGRYVAFCANLRLSTRGDLYIKDLKRKSLAVKKGLCGALDRDRSMPAPIVSEDGQAILVRSYNAEPATLVLRRSEVRVLPAGATGHALAPDGSAVFYRTSVGADGVVPGFRYDVATGSVIPTSLGDPITGYAGPTSAYDYRGWESGQNMTRRGRYVAYSGSVLPAGVPPAGTPWSFASQIGVFDRQTATTTDLTPVLTQLGLPRQWGPTADGSTQAYDYPVRISGDGKYFFFGASATKWYRLQILP
jgi:hypothetical protein